VAGSRVLLDTNVLVSAMLFGGKPRRCLEAVASGRVVLVSLVHIFQELMDVLSRPRLCADADDVAAFIEDLTDIADILPVAGAQHGVCRDADDEPVLLAAVLGKADMIVTGDRDLLELAHPPLPIVTVDAFLSRLT